MELFDTKAAECGWSLHTITRKLDDVFAANGWAVVVSGTRQSQLFQRETKNSAYTKREWDTVIYANV